MRAGRVMGYLRNLGCSVITAAATPSKAKGEVRLEPGEEDDVDAGGGVLPPSTVRVARLQLPLSFPKPKRGAAPR